MHNESREIEQRALARTDDRVGATPDGSPGRPFILFESELREIVTEAARWPDRETGGDLFGYWTHTGCPVVHYVLGPGPGARREVAAFYQDADYLEREGRDLIDRYALQHLGEWHSHHSLGLERPSGGDNATIASALSRYGLPRFALVICTVRREHQAAGGRATVPPQPLVAARNFLFTAGRGGYDEGPWVVLPGASPVRLLHGGAAVRAGATSGVAPAYELRPATAALSDLRRGVAVRSPAEALGQGWYTAPDAQQRLRKELEAFAAAGVDARMLLGSGGELAVVAETDDGSMRYSLSAGFPDAAPLVFRTSREGTEHLDLAAHGVRWEPDQGLSGLHAALSEPAPPQQKSVEQTLPPARRPVPDWRTMLVVALCLARDIVIGPGEGDRPYARHGRRRGTRDRGSSTKAEAALACHSHPGEGRSHKDEGDARQSRTKDLDLAAARRVDRRGGSRA